MWHTAKAESAGDKLFIQQGYGRRGPKGAGKQVYNPKYDPKKDGNKKRKGTMTDMRKGKNSALLWESVGLF